MTSDRSQAASAASTVPSRWMPTASPSPLASLTPREREALEMLATGLSPEQVAAVMGTTIWAVRRHTESIRAKLDSANTTNAAFKFGFELGRQSAA